MVRNMNFMTPRRAKLPHARWLSIAALVAGLLATAFAYWQSQGLVDHDRVSRLDAQATDIGGRIERQLRDYTMILRGSRAYFVAQPMHTAGTFHRLVRLLELEHHYAGLYSAGYAVRGGLPGDGADTTMSVRYSEPGSAPLSQVGSNLVDWPGWRDAIGQARDTGRLTIGVAADAARASLPADELLFFMPLYHGVDAPDTVTQRRIRFAGGVFLQVRAGDMLRDVIGTAALDAMAVRVRHVDEARQDGEQPILFDDRQDRPYAVLGQFERLRRWIGLPGMQSRVLQRTLTVPVADANWRIVLTPYAGYGDSWQSWLPLGFLLAGILLNLLLFRYIRSLGQARQVSEERATFVERSLQQAERQLADVVASISEVLCTLDMPSGRLSYASPAVQQVYGVAPDAFLRHPGLWQECILPEDRERVGQFLRSLENGRTATVYCRIVRADGDVRWMRYNARRTASTAEWPERIDLVGSDVTDEYALQESLRLRQRAIEASANAIVITRATAPDYPIEYVNPAFERMTGYRSADVLGRNMRLLRRDDSDQEGVNELRTLLRQHREGSATLRNYRKDGSLFWSKIYVAPVRNEAGEVSHFVAAKYDITETKQYQERLEHQATHDALTGLANRNLLRTRLASAIERMADSRQPLWVAFLDLDHFKFINDTLGHGAGDFLLQQVARRLLHALRPQDTLARQGGDEFVLVLCQSPGDESNERVLEHVMEVVQQPLQVDGHRFYTSCSIGVSVYPCDGEHPETLIKNADIAMYHAKETGRNKVEFFTAEMNARAMERLRLESDLRQALAMGQFVLHYQPQVDLAEGRITGVEALIRWQHPELGLIAPGQFIRLAEETGLIVPIGIWVMREACAQVQAWREQGLGRLQVSVNLSARQFTDSDLPQIIDDVLRQTGLDPSQLEIELTETLLMSDVDYSSNVLAQLKARGLRVQIDDFGTGYSSLAYLKRFPLDVLKIDRSFVHDIAVDAADAAIAEAVIALAHGLGLGVIAEGVETYEQLAHLQAKGCFRMQGFYFSKPLPAQQMEVLLRRAADDLTCLWQDAPGDAARIDSLQGDA